MVADDGNVPPKPGRAGLWATLAVLALVALMLAGVFMWRSAGTPKPETAQPAGPAAAAPSPVVASAQAKTVADLLAAYAVDDRPKIESLLSQDNLPWTAPPPPIPAGVPKFLVQGMVEPQQRGTRWVLGNRDFALVTLTGNGLNPTGRVDAVIEVQGGKRDATATLVLESGKWKVKAIDDQPVGVAVESLLR